MALGDPAAEVRARVGERAGGEQCHQQPMRAETPEMRGGESLADVGGGEFRGPASGAAAAHGAERRVRKHGVEARRIQRQAQGVPAARAEAEPAEHLAAPRVGLVHLQVYPGGAQNRPREASRPGARLQHHADAMGGGHDGRDALRDGQRRGELRLLPRGLRQCPAVEPLALAFAQRGDPVRGGQVGQLGGQMPVRRAFQRVVYVVQRPAALGLVGGSEYVLAPAGGLRGGPERCPARGQGFRRGIQQASDGRRPETFPGVRRQGGWTRNRALPNGGGREDLELHGGSGAEWAARGTPAVRRGNARPVAKSAPPFSRIAPLPARESALGGEGGRC